MEKLFENINELILESPMFEDAKKCHDWRNHVHDEFISNWDNLTLREKKIIYIFAEDMANREEWD